jgi:hypothetical protein
MFVSEASLEASYCFVAGSCHEPKKVLVTCDRVRMGCTFSLEPNLQNEHGYGLQALKAGADLQETSTSTKTHNTSFEDDSTDCSGNGNSEYSASDIASPTKDDLFDSHIDKALAQQVAMCAIEMQKPCNRWWTSSQAPLICPLSNFPICLLPYPPFKLRMLPEGDAGPHKLVDGKFLSLMVIASEEMIACGRELQPNDVKALDAYMQRCKLGSLRLGRAVALKEASMSLNHSAEEQQVFASKLNELRLAACAELRKLQQIQKYRIARICQEMGNADQDV